MQIQIQVQIQNQNQARDNLDYLIAVGDLWSTQRLEVR